MARRPERPLFIVDIAVPRDADPAVANVPNVSLVDIDGLKALVDERLELRREAIPAVEEIIDEYVERFENWYRSRVAVPVIARLTRRPSRSGPRSWSGCSRAAPTWTSASACWSPA